MSEGVPKTVAELADAGYNPRAIGEREMAALGHSMSEFGDISGLVFNVRTGRLVAGHQRKGHLPPEAKIEGFKPQKDGVGTVGYGRVRSNGAAWPVRFVDWPEPKEKAANVAANSPTLTGDFTEGLMEILDGIGEESPDLFDGLDLSILKDEAAILMDDLPEEEPEDAPPQIDKAAELQEQWQVKRGDVWLLPSRDGKRVHRVMCGDATQECRAPGGGLLATDPPYNVGVDYGESTDDSKREADYRAFCEAWFTLWRGKTERQIVTPGYDNLATWVEMFGKPYYCAAWTKTNSMTRGHVSRFACVEPVLFFEPGWKRERANDVFNFPVGEQGGVANHPCPKPLTMWADIIESYTEPGNSVADPFLGSGTTLIAAENLDRVCYGMEIEPKYVAVALQRYKDTFDIEGVREDA